MLAVYCETPDLADPLRALRVGPRPEPEIPAGWVRVRVTHAGVNRHDLFTLQGITGQPTPIPFPMILGNDAAGLLDDGAEVVLYPVVTETSLTDDETLHPDWHVLSEKIPGTMAEYVAVPERNALPLPEGLSAPAASVMGTAWLTAYRMLFVKAGLRPGQTMFVQGATGGVSTALIQLGCAAGFEVWAASRSREGLELAERLGARRLFAPGQAPARSAHAVLDGVGAATLADSLRVVRRGGTVVTVGVTTGRETGVDLLPIIVDQITLKGSIMGTRSQMEDLLRFVADRKIDPQIGRVLPLDRAAEAFADMWAGRTRGKIVLTT